MVVKIRGAAVKADQSERLKEGATPKSSMMKSDSCYGCWPISGDVLRARPKKDAEAQCSPHEQASRTATQKRPDRRITGAGPVARALSGSERRYSAILRPSALNALQIDEPKRVITVGRSKSVAGEGRTIPIGETIQAVLHRHRAGTERDTSKNSARSGPNGTSSRSAGRALAIAARPVTTLSTSWRNVRKRPT